MSGILVFVETASGVVDRLSAEAMRFAAGHAKASGGALDAVVIAGGEDAAGAESVAAGLGGYGVATAHLVVGDGLGAYAPAAWAAGIGSVVAAGSYDAVIAAGERPRDRGARAGRGADRPTDGGERGLSGAR